MEFLGQFGCAIVMGIAALGSAIGIMISGQAAIGSWKRCYMANKPAPFILTVFAGAPLTQTIYGFLLMQTMMGSSAAPGFKLVRIQVATVSPFSLKPSKPPQFLKNLFMFLGSL